MAVALLAQAVDEVGADGLHRRAAGVGRCHLHVDASLVVLGDVAQDAEVLDGDDGQLGVEDPRRDLPGARLPAGAEVVGGHHVAPGCERVRCCISASSRPRCSVCSPARPPGTRAGASGTCSVAGAYDVPEAPQHGLAQARGSHGHPLGHQRRVEVGLVEQLLDPRPLGVQGGLHAGVGLLGAVAEAQHPLARVVVVVGHLLGGLGRDRGEHEVAAALERGVQLGLPGREHEQPRHGDPEVLLRALDQLDVAEVALVAPVGQVVLVAALPLQLTGVRQQRPRLAEQVETDVGQREVLLELGRPADPPAHPLGGDQGVVGEAQDVVGVGGRHRCSTPSGTS